MRSYITISIMNISNIFANGLTLTDTNSVRKSEGKGSAKEALKALNALRFETLTEEQQRAILQIASAQVLTAQVLEKAKAVSYSVTDLINKWIDSYESAHTKTAYLSQIKKWTAYCGEQSIEPLLAKPIDADNYAAELRARYRARTANLAVDAASAFYSMMIKWEILERTPFIRTRRAVTPHATHRVPSEKEIADVVKRQRLLNSPIAHAILFLRKTGARAGLLPTLTLQGKRYIGVSKGKPYSVPALSKFDIAQWKGMSANRICVAIKRAFKGKYSAHDLRHAYAIDLYRKTGNDIEAVRRALQHSNIAVTTTYLQGLGAL